MSKLLIPTFIILSIIQFYSVYCPLFNFTRLNVCSQRKLCYNESTINNFKSNQSLLILTPKLNDVINELTFTESPKSWQNDCCRPLQSPFWMRSSKFEHNLIPFYYTFTVFFLTPFFYIIFCPSMTSSGGHIPYLGLWLALNICWRSPVLGS